eukprot:293835-Pleurochrysis_carterae.AAC.4
MDAPLLFPAKDCTSLPSSLSRRRCASPTILSTRSISYLSTTSQYPPPSQSGCRSRASASPVKTTAAVGHNCDCAS